MLKDGKIWMANNDKGENLFILPKMANRHGLVAGATGTGKTITLKVMAETFSEMGVPVFMADVKGDIAGMMCPGIDTEDMQKRIEKFGLGEAGSSYQGRCSSRASSSSTSSRARCSTSSSRSPTTTASCSSTRKTSRPASTTCRSIARTSRRTTAR